MIQTLVSHSPTKTGKGAAMSQLQNTKHLQSTISSSTTSQPPLAKHTENIKHCSYPWTSQKRKKQTLCPSIHCALFQNTTDWPLSWTFSWPFDAGLLANPLQHSCEGHTKSGFLKCLKLESKGNNGLLHPKTRLGQFRVSVFFDQKWMAFFWAKWRLGVQAGHNVAHGRRIGRSQVFQCLWVGEFDEPIKGLQLSGGI